MVVTRRSATRVGDPPPLPNPSPLPKKRRGGKGKVKVAAEKDDILERHAMDMEDVTMADVTVTHVGHIASGKSRGPQAGKANLVSKSGETSKRKLDESESEAEAASETPTGNIHAEDESDLSELSAIEEGEPAVELTPKPASKPPKKKARETSPFDTPVKSGQPLVNTTHLLGASSKPPASGPTGASLPFTMDEDDLAVWMGVPSKFAATKTIATSGSASRPDARSSSSRSEAVSSSTLSSGNSSSLPSKPVARAGQSVDTLLPRTKATAPSAFAKPPKPETQPFQSDKGPVKSKTKSRLATKAKRVVGSDDEEPERVAALSSPPKGGARPTSSHVVKIKEEPTSPRPAKFSVNVVEPTPRKIDQESKVDKRGRAGKGKRKVPSQSEDEDSSDVEIVEPEDAPDPLTLKPRARSQDNSRSRSRSHSASRPSKTWRLEDLPEAAQSRWKSEVLPALLRFQGARVDPWTFTDARSVRAMQQIWDAIYGDEVPHRVVLNDCVHGFAYQCLCNWRSAIRSSAESVVGAFFEQNLVTRTLDGRATFSTKILHGKRYLYENPFNANNKRLFRSKYFLTILGWHLEAAKDAVDVAGLYDKPIRPDRPIGVFGLAAAALERIFKLFESQLMAPPLSKDGKPAQGLWRVIPQVNPQTGKTSKSQTEFSERRFSSHTKYFIDCANSITPDLFNAVLTAAQEYMGLRRVIARDASVPTTEAEGEEALLEDGD